MPAVTTSTCWRKITFLIFFTSVLSFYIVNNSNQPCLLRVAHNRIITEKPEHSDRQRGSITNYKASTGLNSAIVQELQKP